MIEIIFKMKSLILFSVIAVVLSTGQWEEVAEDDEQIRIAANFAAKILSMRLNSPYHSKLTQIHKAERQVRLNLLY